MCVSMPARVLSVDDGGRSALVDVDGSERHVALTILVLDGTPVAAGDWLLVHTGLAVEILAPDDAADLLELHRSVHGTRREVQ
jgi:hydrogenase assembly chaperone HypC/HupF